MPGKHTMLPLLNACIEGTKPIRASSYPPKLQAICLFIKRVNSTPTTSHVWHYYVSSSLVYVEPPSHGLYLLPSPCIAACSSGMQVHSTCSPIIRLPHDSKTNPILAQEAHFVKSLVFYRSCSQNTDCLFSLQ